MYNYLQYTYNVMYSHVLKKRLRSDLQVGPSAWLSPAPPGETTAVLMEDSECWILYQLDLLIAASSA